MFEQERPLSLRAEALVDLAQRSLGTMTKDRRSAGLEALRARLCGRPPARRAQRAALVLTGTLAIAGSLALAVSLAQHRGDLAPAVALHMDGADLPANGAVESAGSVLRFSDGSEIALGDRTRIRVRSIDERGARVTLEHGEAHVYVVHGPGTRWTFDAGPFAVAVTGTAFVLSWREDVQRLDLRLENGTVSVAGPLSDTPLTLRAGQWLTAQGTAMRIRSLDAVDDALDPSPSAAPPSAEVAPAPAEAPSPPGNPTPGQSAAAAGSGKRRNAAVPAREHDWAGDLARGRPFKAIVGDAVALGVDSVIAQSGSEELAALADAARYTLRQDIARGALLAQRRRFPASNRARAAAFDLGRIEEAGQNSRAALAWFDTYLAEAPNGRYASEALGRKMTLVKVLEGSDAARSWADLYLLRFPGGTYAAAARAATGGAR
jgi:ferric-dicitrate binding protein FerR (iron transport regulator)